MPLIIEDGTGKVDGQSYMSVDDFEAMATLRGAALTTEFGSSEQVLLTAMTYIESQTFIGFKNTRAQALQWPRSGVVIDGYDYEPEEIPGELISALYETAIAVDAGLNPLATTGRATKREKVGDLEVEYMDNARAASTFPAINAALKKIVLTLPSSSVGVVQVVRG
jgi:hypothetical protein